MTREPAGGTSSDRPADDEPVGMKPGAEPLGTEPSGAARPGPEPSGAEPPGAAPSGADPPGSELPGEEPPGAAPSGPEPPGSDLSGAEPSGTAPELAAAAARRGRGRAMSGRLVRAGLRGLLDLTRVDVALLVGLTLLAFVLRFGSPILPNFLGGNATSVPAIQVLGVGSAYNSSASACEEVPIGNKTVKACGQVFDEVYFPTDAADDLHSPAISYFDPEPPLVKLLMTPSIALLGFNTMGWRMTQVVTGSLLCGLMYLIALRLRRDRFFAIVASLLVCLDGLAFVESRLGLIDIPAIFFVALTWYLFLLHWQARTRRQWRLTLYVLAAGSRSRLRRQADRARPARGHRHPGRLPRPGAVRRRRGLPALRRIAGPAPVRDRALEGGRGVEGLDPLHRRPDAGGGDLLRQLRALPDHLP